MSLCSCSVSPQARRQWGQVITGWNSELKSTLPAIGWFSQEPLSQWYTADKPKPPSVPHRHYLVAKGVAWKNKLESPQMRPSPHLILSYYILSYLILSVPIYTLPSSLPEECPSHTLGGPPCCQSWLAVVILMLWTLTATNLNLIMALHTRHPPGISSLWLAGRVPWGLRLHEPLPSLLYGLGHPYLPTAHKS